MNKSLQTISILGCGWLGLPLATHLIRTGYLIKGSTTNDFTLQVLNKSGIEGYLVNFSEEISMDHSLNSSDILIITIPPAKEGGEEKSIERHRKIAHFASESNARLIIYCSSTSAYSDESATLTEENSSDTTHAVRLEKLYQNKIPNLVIVRFGGLYGPGRNPGKFLAGKTDLPKPLAPVNMTHLEDAVNAISIIINSDKTGIYNVVAPQHPMRKQFYAAYALAEKLVPPVFDETDLRSGKIISSDKLVNDFNFHFSHPDPML